MRIRLVQSLKGGEKLTEPVITEKKEVLISSGTVLKPEYLDLLLFLGVNTVSIEDPYESYEMATHMILEETREGYVSEVQSILESHIHQDKNSLQKINNLAEKMVDELMNADEEKVIDMAERNGDLYEHTVMVTLLAIEVARRLKLKREQIITIAVGSLLHDLGLRYITVPFINCDMEKKQAAETFEYHKHTILGFSALENETWLSPEAKNMILMHHERKDGSGFPLKQKTKEIGCNIIQACDAFDCMISGVECKRARIEEIMEYLAEASDVLFEGKIVRVLQKLVARYPVGTRLKLSTGEASVVLRQTSDSIRPVVGVLDENHRMTDKRYSLDKERAIAVLQIES